MKTTQLIMDGENQAVLIPSEYELPWDMELEISREGEVLIIKPLGVKGERSSMNTKAKDDLSAS